MSETNVADLNEFTEAHVSDLQSTFKEHSERHPLSIERKCRELSSTFVLHLLMFQDGRNF